VIAIYHYGTISEFTLLAQGWWWLYSGCY